MRLTVVFETWLLGDGVYPPLARGQFVNIALQLQASEIRQASRTVPLCWESLDEAKYRVVAEVLEIFRGDRNEPTVALDAGGLRMYVENCKLKDLGIRDRIEAVGTLGFDYYWWSERVSLEPDAPDLFHKFYIERMRRVPIPTRFIRRSNKTVTSPTRVDASEWESERIEDVARMADESGCFDFYLVDLDDGPAVAHPVPRTFIS
jgi:hypothetical protein